MARLFSTDFEFPSFPGPFQWVHSSAILDTAVKYGGLQSGKFPVSSSVAREDVPAGNSFISFRGRFRVDSLTTGNAVCVLRCATAAFAKFLFELVVYNGLVQLHYADPSVAWGSGKYRSASSTGLIAGPFITIEVTYIQGVNGGYLVYIEDQLAIDSGLVDTSAWPLSISEAGQVWSNYMVAVNLDDYAIAQEHIGFDGGPPPPPPVYYTITYSSAPISVEAMINGSPMPSGGQIELLEGTPVTIVIPQEVNL